MNKNIVLITGFEGSGSVFQAQVISYVLGKCAVFGEWSGYGWNGGLGDNQIIVHRSMPYGREPKRWVGDLLVELEKAEEYNIRIVICTRDLTISKQSRIRRFGGNSKEYKVDDLRARHSLLYLMKRYDYFIFSYETAIALGQIYYKELYQWLGVASCFRPPLRDMNSKNIKKLTEWQNTINRLFSRS